MSEAKRLIVELDTSSDPVRGSIGASGSGSEQFSGYVQLIAALERHRSPETARSAGTGGYRGERETPGLAPGSLGAASPG